MYCSLIGAHPGTGSPALLGAGRVTQGSGRARGGLAPVDRRPAEARSASLALPYARRRRRRARTAAIARNKPRIESPLAARVGTASSTGATTNEVGSPDA